jgi:hypothetical protein
MSFRSCCCAVLSPRFAAAGLICGKESMLKGGKSGPAIVLGNLRESVCPEFAGEMPPKKRLIQVGVKPMALREIDKIALD